jgi:hypothetical protein
MSGDLKSQKKPIDVQCLSFTDQGIKEIISSGEFTGPFHTPLAECLPIYESAPCETVIAGDNNAFVILGRDRPYSLGSGKGASGGKCGRIHMIAGLAAAYDNASDALETGPNLITDAATVYITQRGNIDAYFGLPPGKNRSADDRSAIALKADHTRIIARESVKIYAGPTKTSSIKKEKNSATGELDMRGRIDLIAGDDENLQPAVLGDYLAEYLSELSTLIRQICVAVEDLNKRTNKINNALAIHTHTLLPLAPITNMPNFVLQGVQKLDILKGKKGKINHTWTNLNVVLQEFNAFDFDDLLPIKGRNNFLSDNIYIT